MIETIQGDMADLRLRRRPFRPDRPPRSNVFAHDVRPVWREVFRVLRPGGVLISGFASPVLYLFDYFAMGRGEFRVTHRIPYSDVADLARGGACQVGRGRKAP